MTIYINQNIFDEETEEGDYLLGAFYMGYLPFKEKGILFRSSNRNLVKLVKEQLEKELESGHSITADSRGKSSYWITLPHAPHMRSRLEELGLEGRKAEREFPENMKEEGLSHFVRGVVDAKSSIWVVEGRTTVCFYSNQRFLSGLHQVLVEYAGVERKGPERDCLPYGHKDSLKIHDFIYRDWEIIKEKKIYLPEKKELFLIDSPENKQTDKVCQRVEKAKKLFKEGKSWKVAAEEVGYAHPPALCRAFKGITGKTIREFKKELGGFI